MSLDIYLESSLIRQDFTLLLVLAFSFPRNSQSLGEPPPSTLAKNYNSKQTQISVFLSPPLATRPPAGVVGMSTWASRREALPTLEVLSPQERHTWAGEQESASVSGTVLCSHRYSLSPFQNC